MAVWYFARSRERRLSRKCVVLLDLAVPSSAYFAIRAKIEKLFDQFRTVVFQHKAAMRPSS